VAISPTETGGDRHAADCVRHRGHVSDLAVERRQNEDDHERQRQQSEQPRGGAGGAPRPRAVEHGQIDDVGSRKQVTQGQEVGEVERAQKPPAIHQHVTRDRQDATEPRRPDIGEGEKVPEGGRRPAGGVVQHRDRWCKGN